ncbi:hypothetical protein BC826DRAFT_342790 [Russula brevipes]|nr:hypothetical protein BC826DRAFT_342790 [Russula brevipes]
MEILMVTAATKCAAPDFKSWSQLSIANTFLSTETKRWLAQSTTVGDKCGVYLSVTAVLQFHRRRGANRIYRALQQRSLLSSDRHGLYRTLPIPVLAKPCNYDVTPQRSMTGTSSQVDGAGESVTGLTRSPSPSPDTASPIMHPVLRVFRLCRTSRDVAKRRSAPSFSLAPSSRNPAPHRHVPQASRGAQASLVFEPSFGIATFFIQEIVNHPPSHLVLRTAYVLSSPFVALTFPLNPFIHFQLCDSIIPFVPFVNLHG